MSWIRSPIVLGAVLLFVGALVRVVVAFPDLRGTMSQEDLRKALEFQRTERPILKLEPQYRPYAFAFVFARSPEDVEAIKRTIDAEIAAVAAIKERGLAGVPEYVGERLIRIDLVLMSLGAALLFRTLAFVLAVAFGAGVLHQMLAQSGTLARAPSEIYLAAVLAALIWATLFWAVRARYEGRLRLGT